MTFGKNSKLPDSNADDRESILRKLSLRSRRKGGLGPIEMAYIEHKLPSKKIKRTQKTRLAKRSIALGSALAILVIPGFLVGISAYTGILFGGAVTELKIQYSILNTDPNFCSKVF